MIDLLKNHPQLLSWIGAFISLASPLAWKFLSDRILAKMAARHAEELKTLELDLKNKVNIGLTQLNFELETTKEKMLKAHSEKLDCYNFAIDSTAVFMHEMSWIIQYKQGREAFEKCFFKFDAARIRTYGRMALLAPQNVMDTYDRLIDYFIGVRGGSEMPDWDTSRDLALDWINAARIDIGINPAPVAYLGSRHPSTTRSPN